MHKDYMQVAPSSIGGIFEKSPLRQTERRIPQYFEIKFNRLRVTDNSISNIGPRLCNNTINKINKILSFTYLSYKISSLIHLRTTLYVTYSKNKNQTQKTFRGLITTLFFTTFKQNTNNRQNNITSVRILNVIFSQINELR